MDNTVSFLDERNPRGYLLSLLLLMVVGLISSNLNCFDKLGESSSVPTLSLTMLEYWVDLKGSTLHWDWNPLVWFALVFLKETF